MTEILFFTINIILIAYLIYRERQHEKSLQNILVAKLSRDASEFMAMIEKPTTEEQEEEPTEIPLDDVAAEEMLGVLNKKQQ